MATAGASKPASAQRSASAGKSDFEDLRAGARILLLADYSESLRKTRHWAPGQGATADDSAKVAAMERTFFGTAMLAARQERGAEPRRVYSRYLKQALTALRQHRGPYPDETLAFFVWRGSTTPAEAMSEASLRQADEPEHPRDLCRKMLLATLLADARFAAAREQALDVAHRIEAACYQLVIERGKTSGTLYRRHWDCQTFVDTYAVHCGTVNTHLDPRSSVGAAYGTSLLDNLWSGTLRPEELGFMEATDMCPEATRPEREVIKKRNEQKVTVKASNLFRCPNCGQRRCEIQPVQRRALDEAPDYDCVCLNPDCGAKFKGKS